MALNVQPRQEELVFNTSNAGGGFEATPQPLKYAISGRPMFATATVFLDSPDSQVKADSGAMMFMDESVDMKTSFDGCCDAMIRHFCAGEGACFNTFSGPGFVTFGFDEPGDMLAFAVTPGFPWLLTAGAFIAGSTNISVSSRMGSCANYCLGGDLFLTRVSANEGLGMFFAGGYGQIIRQEVPEGQTLLVNNSLFFAAHEDTSQSAQLGMLGNLWTCMWGGEGLVMKFRGPCVVYTQSRDPTIMNQLVIAKNSRKQARSGARGAAPS